MFRRRIHSTCNRVVHPFPISMRYGGSRFWRGMRVHVMYCPVCGRQRYYVYRGWEIKRVA